MAALSGWLAVSTQPRVDAANPFVDAGYVRTACAWACSPTMDEQPRLIAGPQVQPGHLIRCLAILDAPVAGYVLAYWKPLPEYTETPADLTPTSVIVTFTMDVLHAFNRTRLYGGASELCEINRGDSLGRCNGQNLLAGVRLIVTDGTLRRPGTVKAKAAAA